MDGIDKLIDSIKRIIKKETEAYDTAATVRRIEGNTAWVHIDGGVDETPVKLTINAQPGDNVQVRVSGGKAFLVGNGSAPPTDDRVANYARSIATTAQTTAEGAQEAAEAVTGIATAASANASAAITLAEGIDDHFWSDSAGAHITEDTQEDYLDDPSAAGGNTLITSAGMAIRHGTTQLAAFTSSGAQIGRAGSSNMTVDTTGIRGANVDNVEMFSVDMDGATRTIEARQSYSSREFQAWIDTSHTSPTLSSGANVSLSSSATTISISPGEFVLKLIGPVSFPTTSYITVTNGSISSRENRTLTIATNQIQFNVGTSGSATVSVACTNMTGIGGINADIVIAYDGDHVISFDYYLWINSSSDFPVTFLLNSYIISSYDTPAPSYTLGTRSGNNGPFSTVIGEGLTAEYDDQTAVGKFNDNQSTNALEIGNGTSSSPSNALTVDWSGNVEAAGDIEDGSGNVLSNKIESSWHCYGNYHGVSSSLTLATSDKKVSLGSFSGSGCSASSNGIKIDSSHAGTYSISGAIYASTGYTANDIVHAVIYKNSTLIGDAGKRVSNGSPYEIIPVGPLVVDLAAGDVVYLYARNQSGARGTVASYGNTQLNVGLNLYRIG